VKVLVVSNLYPPSVIGGYELSCAQVVDELMRRGYDVRVLTSVPGRITSGSDHVARVLRHPDCFRTERSATLSDKWEVEANLIDSGNVYSLIGEVESFRPDVCYLWNLIGIGGLGLVGTLEYLGVPWLWHLGDAVPAYLCMFEGHVLPIARQMSDRLTGRFVAVSQGLVNEIEHVVTLGDRVRVVPNWVSDPGERLRRSYFDEGVLRVAFAGQLAEHKGVYMLLDAVAEVVRRGHDVRLDLFGEGDRAGVVAHVASTGLRDRVRVLGWVEQRELRRRLREYDVFAFPTWQREPFGLAPLEAASEGCVPLVSTPSGPAEWLVDGVDCLKAIRRPEAFAEAMSAICRGEVDMASLGRRAAAVVRRDFVLSRVMPVLEEELAAAAALGYRPTGDAETAYRLALVAEGLVRSAVSSGRPKAG